MACVREAGVVNWNGQVQSISAHPLQVPWYLPAVKTNGQWEYNATSNKSPGPLHPSHNSLAIIYVTRNGSLKLLSQAANSPQWPEIKGDLESISSSSDLLTHASFSPEPGTPRLISITNAHFQIFCADRFRWEHASGNTSFMWTVTSLSDTGRLPEISIAR